MGSVYQIWSNPKYKPFYVQRPTDIFHKLLLHNLTTASILNYEIRNLDTDIKLRTTDSVLYKLYFRSIIRMLKLNLSEEYEILNLVKSKVGDKFELLLSHL